MKAQTKASKRRSRAGRPRKEDVPREPNGRVSRSGKHTEPADTVGLEARMRQMGLTWAQARDQRAGSYIGYLAILGRADGLSQEQYEAAVNYKDLREAQLRAISAPNAERDGFTAGNGGADISDEYADWCRRTIERYTECKAAIQDAQNANRAENLWAALDYCVIRNEHMPQMIGGLRIACNALARFFRG